MLAMCQTAHYLPTSTSAHLLNEQLLAARKFEGGKLGVKSSGLISGGSAGDERLEVCQNPHFNGLL
jgi:hypothetical protein